MQFPVFKELGLDLSSYQPWGLMEILLESFVEGLEYGAVIGLEIPGGKMQLCAP